MPWNVYVTRKIPPAGLEKLAGETPFDMNPHDRALTRQELLAAVAGRDGLITLLTDHMDAEVMDAAGERLKVIANMAVGYDNIDVEEADKRGIAVTHTPGVLTETTADFTWALLMGIARRVVESDKYLRSGNYKAWDPLLLLGGDIYGKTLGIIGFGRIGEAVSRRAIGFNMKILVYDPFFKGELRNLKIRLVPLVELLQESDFITLHPALTPETRHLIGEKEFDLMKPAAYLVNASRGPVVDEAALAKALKSNTIAGAALDVYENEPSVHPDLLGLDNVILAPHVASASVDTRNKMAEMAAVNLLAVLKGELPLNPVKLSKVTG